MSLLSVRVGSVAEPFPCHTSHMAEIPIVAVVGATASGKTDLSLDLAERLGGEIVNTDAMQVYRGMDVGTAKLPAAERRGIPHHLLDILDVRDPLTVAEFQEWARAVVAELRGPRRTSRSWSAAPRSTPARSWTASSSPAPTRPSASGSRPSSPRSAPPPCTGRLPSSTRRPRRGSWPRTAGASVRALEVIEITGRPYSASLPTLEYADPHTVQIGVDIDRPTLDERIERRVERMFEDGFVAEVERLLDEGLAEGRTASRAIGYREVVAYLAGELTLDEARERTVFATRRFARRQDSLVPQGPAHRLGAVRRPRPARAGPRGRRRLSKIGRVRGSVSRRQTDAMTESSSGRDRLRELLDAVLDEDNRSLRRHGRRGVLLAVPLQPAALPRCPRAAGGDAPPGDARAGGLADPPGHLGHRRRVRGRLRVGRGLQPGVRPGLRPPAERPRRTRQPLAAGAERHPLPPAHLAVGAHHGAADEPPDRTADRTTTSTTPATCSTCAKQLPDEEYRRERLPGNAAIGFDGLDESIADVLTHIVFTKEVWLAAIEGDGLPAGAGRRPGHADRAARVGRAALAAWCADIERRGAWDDRLVDALCDPPESFVLAASSPTC